MSARFEVSDDTDVTLLAGVRDILSKNSGRGIHFWTDLVAAMAVRTCRGHRETLDVHPPAVNARLVVFHKTRLRHVWVVFDNRLVRVTLDACLIDLHVINERSEVALRKDVVCAVTIRARRNIGNVLACQLTVDTHAEIGRNVRMTSRALHRRQFLLVWKGRDRSMALCAIDVLVCGGLEIA